VFALATRQRLHAEPQPFDQTETALESP
jgi:hypothetical protein